MPDISSGQICSGDEQSTEQKKLDPLRAKIGDIWHRVDGTHIGDEVYEGMQLEWTSWICIKTTPKGAWFKCVEWEKKKLKFALTSSSLAISRTKREALRKLIDKKIRHLRILESEATAAEDVLEAARAALAQIPNS